MKILITGIGGFVGPHLRQELLKARHKVIGIDKRENKELNTISCDLLNAENVTSVMSEIQPDAIVHLAAVTSVQESWKNPEAFLRVNTEMTRNVVSGALSVNPHMRILLTSSSDVYGPQASLPITEDAAPSPQNPYAKSKLAQEQVTQEFPQLKIVISRSFNHTGPGTSDSLAVGAFAKQIALCEKGMQKEILVGNLDAYRDFSDVRDVVRAYRMLIEHETNKNLYNICSGKKIQIKEILHTLLSFSKKNIQVVEDPERMRPSDVAEFWGSHKRISDELGWFPELPFSQTLKETLEYFREKEKAPASR